jgi:hypothetical protein
MDKQMKVSTVIINNFSTMGAYALITTAAMLLYLYGWGTTNNLQLAVLYLVGFFIINGSLILWGFFVLTPLPKRNYLSVILLTFLLCIPSIYFAISNTSLSSSAAQIYMLIGLIAPIQSTSIIDMLLSYPSYIAGADKSNLYLIVISILPSMLLYSGLQLRLRLLQIKQKKNVE